MRFSILASRAVGPLMYCLSSFYFLTDQKAAALTINAIYDSSITSSVDASEIETAFNTVVNDFDTALSSKATINVDVSWGSVAGETLPSNAVGASIDSLNIYTYAQVKTALTAAAIANPRDSPLQSSVAHLSPFAPSGVTKYAVPSAEAKALGMISPTRTAVDGYIGFAGSTSGYTFNPSHGVAGGTYDFESVAAHELEEVLGRISGIPSLATPGYRSVMDLYRYSAPGVLSDSYATLSYFSINGGVTPLGYYNNSGYGGDAGDWLTAGEVNNGTPASDAVLNDVQDAFINTGVANNLSAVDLTVLDALGYNGSNIGITASATPTAVAFNLDGTVPEPASAAILLPAIGALAACRAKWHRRKVSPPS